MKNGNRLQIIKISFLILLLLAFCADFFPAGLNAFKAGYRDGFNLRDVSANSNSAPVVLAIICIATPILLIKIVMDLYQLIKAISGNKAFTLGNIIRTIRIGRNCIIYNGLLLMFYVSGYFAYSGYGLKIVSFSEVPFWPAIMGVTFLAIGYAFKKGLELQQENELTV